MIMVHTCELQACFLCMVHACMQGDGATASTEPQQTIVTHAIATYNPEHTARFGQGIA
jgi:hypothetical protein